MGGTFVPFSLYRKNPVLADGIFLLAFLVHLLSAAQIHRAVGHGSHAVEALAGALCHAGDSVGSHDGLNTGAGLHQLIKTVDQRTSAGHDDTVVGDIRHQLGRRALQHTVDGLENTQFRSNRIIAIALQVMRAGVAAVIFDVVINLAKNVIATKRTLYILLMATAFVGKVILGVDAMIVILCCLVVGLVDLAMELRSNRKVVA